MKTEQLEYLYEYYPKVVKKEIINLKRLNDFKIKKIVNKVPNGVITQIHKKYIIMLVNF